MARAIATRCAWPRERWPTRRSAASSRPTVASACRARASASPRPYRRREEAQVFARGQPVVEIARVGEDPDLALARRGRGEPVLAAEPHASGARTGEPRQELEEGRLAGAVGAQDQQEVAAVEIERDVVEREARTVDAGQSLDAQQRSGPRHPAPRGGAVRSGGQAPARRSAARPPGTWTDTSRGGSPPRTSRRVPSSPRRRPGCPP